MQPLDPETPPIPAESRGSDALEDETPVRRARPAPQPGERPARRRLSPLGGDAVIATPTSFAPPAAPAPAPAAPAPAPEPAPLAEPPVAREQRSEPSQWVQPSAPSQWTPSQSSSQWVTPQPGAYDERIVDAPPARFEPPQPVSPAAPTTPRVASTRAKSRGVARPVAIAVVVVAIAISGYVVWRAHPWEARSNGEAVTTTDAASNATPVVPSSSVKSPARKGVTAPVVSGPTSELSVLIGAVSATGRVDLASGAYSVKVPAKMIFGDAAGDDLVEVRDIGGRTIVVVPSALRDRSGGKQFVDLGAVVAAMGETDTARVFARSFGARTRMFVLALNPPAGEGQAEVVRGIEAQRRDETLDLDGAMNALRNDASTRALVDEYRPLGTLTIPVWRNPADSSIVQLVVLVPTAGDAPMRVAAGLGAVGQEPAISSANANEVASTFSK